MKEWRPGRRTFLKALGLAAAGAPSALLAACARPQETPSAKPGPQATIDAAVEATVTAREKTTTEYKPLPDTDRKHYVWESAMADNPVFEFDYSSVYWNSGVDPTDSGSVLQSKKKVNGSPVASFSPIRIIPSPESREEYIREHIEPQGGDTVLDKQPQTIANHPATLYTIWSNDHPTYKFWKVAYFMDKDDNKALWTMVLGATTKEEFQEAQTQFEHILRTFTIKPMSRTKPAPAKPAEPAKEQPRSLEYVLKADALNAWLDLFNNTQKVKNDTLITASPNIDTWKGFVPAIVEGKPYPAQPLITGWVHISDKTSTAPSERDFGIQFLGQMQHDNIRLVSFALEAIRGGDEITGVLLRFKHRYCAVSIQKEGPTAQIKKWLFVSDRRPFPEFSPWEDGEFHFQIAKSVSGQSRIEFVKWPPRGITDTAYRYIEHGTIIPSPAFVDAYRSCYNYGPNRSSCKIYQEKF